jgi:hypothetical protein
MSQAAGKKAKTALDRGPTFWRASQHRGEHLRDSMYHWLHCCYDDDGGDDANHADQWEQCKLLLITDKRTDALRPTASLFSLQEGAGLFAIYRFSSANPRARAARDSGA